MVGNRSDRFRLQQDYERSMQIAIDGPAAAGKSTVSQELARRLGFNYIDTGAMYRALTLLAIDNNIDCSDEPGLVSLIDRHNIEFDGTKILVDGDDVSRKIRGEQVTALVSYCCAPRGVRQRMVALQQKIAGETDSVMEGRDIGTVVLPNADLKIYMTATRRERAIRRKTDPSNPELKEAAIEKIEQDIETRDRIDSTREVDPLKVADDAIVMDTTGMSISEVADKIIEILHFNHKPKTPRST